ncbi:MAG: APC family permease [Eubacterium sp.]|jgi:amino acid transporter|nr:APC family permease [Eubacterium sp.]MCI2197155.1 APC family permease [Eubacterium sp.]
MEKINKIGFWELVLMNISALFGIRWIAKSTSDNFGLGLGAIVCWVLFAFLFFVPQALMCAELSSAYPSDGGLGEWVGIAFGNKYKFLVSWLNWTSKIFWYASFLTFFSINAAYMLGRPDLANNKALVLAVSLVIFWIQSFVSMKGMSFGKIFTSIGSLGSTLAAVLLIGLSFLAVGVLHKAPSASVYTVSSMIPKMNMNSFVAISSIMFAYAGAEVTANFASEMKNPQKDFPRAIMLSAGVVCALYVIGSIAMTMLLPTSKIYAYTGTLDGLLAACRLLHIPELLVQVVAGMIMISIFGTLVLYIAQPVKMLFGQTESGIFPEKLTRNNEHEIPSKAVICQAVLVSIVLICASLFPAVETIYNVLVTMTALTSLFPYVLLFLAYVKIKGEKEDHEDLYQMTRNKSAARFLGLFEVVICLIAIVCSALPVMGNFHDNLIYEIEMIGGGLLVIVSGLLIWRHSGLKNKALPISSRKQGSLKKRIMAAAK